MLNDEVGSPPSDKASSHQTTIGQTTMPYHQGLRTGDEMTEEK
jgi:hypothetical protein